MHRNTFLDAPRLLDGHLRLATPQAAALPAPVYVCLLYTSSYGVNTGRFEQGGWSVERATAVNLFSQSSWALSNVAGVPVGNAVGVPLAIASFAMTSIFICLLCPQQVSVENGVAVAVAMAGVYPVSYTHLDVYKRQRQHLVRAQGVPARRGGRPACGRRRGSGVARGRALVRAWPARMSGNGVFHGGPFGAEGRASGAPSSTIPDPQARPSNRKAPVGGSLPAC